MGTNLYVGNVSFNTMEDDLNKLFAECGNVVRCNLIADKYTGRSRGFAFVEMATDAEAQAAIEKLNGKELDGRALRINEARPREERPAGGGGGGRRSGGGYDDRRGGGGEGRREW
jgi:RNA recognition motif-containing protein